MKNPWVVLGKIVKAQGLRGEVKVRSEIDEPENFLLPGLSLRWTDGRSESVIVQRYRSQKGGFVLSLDGCDSIDKAQALLGCELVCRGFQLPELADDEYYHYQLLGLPVFDCRGDELGLLSEIMQTAAHEIYVVKLKNRESGEDELLLPVVAAYILDIDLEVGKIVVDPAGDGGLGSTG
ncbi:MAG: 16S rRNA processing protein RimM [Deltaproteobacteria bacterium]|nr:16S rRNA processing protein RimM [Candidatus Tharpella sp.]